MTTSPPFQGAGLIWLTVAFALIATPGWADPCKAIPDRGPAPPYLARGKVFQGPVSYVGDGDSLCVAVGKRQDQWVEVRLPDFYAPELHAPEGPAAKAALEDVVLGRVLQCRAEKQSYDRVVARCVLKGRSVGDILRARGAVEGGRGR